MADFDTTRSALDAAREQERATRAAVAAAHEAAARLAAEHAAATRIGAAGRLAAQVERARAEEAGLRADLQAASALAGRAAAAFAKAADPRDAIANWSAETPLLLLPVRLETRFKTVTDEAGAHDELWVRIYPDACSVDTFEAALSDTELASARRYWIETWAAGGIEAQHRAAWRNLVASHGAGRAAWIVRESAPAGAPPVKADPADVLLVIAIDAPPGADEQAALSAFWTAAWVAEGDATRLDLARQALAAAPGVTDADALIATFAPANLAAAPAPPATRADVAVDVVWLALPPEPEAKTRSWTAPARVDTLPDRFVVVGYQDDRVVFEAEGRPIPSPLIAGPDPSAPADEQLGHDADGALKLPEPVRWMVDFEAAVAVGMGVKVRDLGATDLTRPLQRVIAIGLRLADDATQGQARLEKLLEHHRFGSAGLALVPQGTPTNNTDEAAGHDRHDDADAAYDALFGAGDALPATAGDWWGRRDGEWLADGLGIGVATLDGVPHAGGTDLAEARAINRALWPATFGYALETMLHPVLDAGQVDATRWFQTHFVLGRGMLPSLRIGDEPYGVLPVSAISQWDWLGGDELLGVGGLRTPDSFIGYRAGLAGVLATMREDWRLLAQEVSFVGKAGDPHQLLLDVVGLHPGSVEFHQRYAESLEDLFNRAKLQGFGAQVADAIRVEPPTGGGARAPRPAGLRGRGGARRALEVLLHAREPAQRPARRRRGGVGARPDPRLHARRARLPRVARRRRARRVRGPPPGARLRGPAARGAAVRPAAARAAARVLGRQPAPASRGGRVDAQEVRTGAARAPVRPRRRRARRVREPLRAAVQHRRARRRGARERRRADRRTTGRRGEHPGARRPARGARPARGRPDGAARALPRRAPRRRELPPRRVAARARQLPARRTALPAARGGDGAHRASTSARTAGWRACSAGRRRCEAVELDDELAAVFAPDGEAPLRDPANGGYVLAPSIGQATTAAILRAGYLANAAPQEPGALAVNLSSARVRVALGLIEGIRNGQPLGALLGYRLQRGLHDRHAGAGARPLPRAAAQAVPARRRPAGVDPDRRGRRDRGDRGQQRGRRPRARRARRPAPAGAHIPSGCRCRPPRRPSAPRSTPRSTRSSTPTTRSPTSRSPRACTRRCSATTTGSPRRSTRTRREASRPSRMSSERRAAGSA